MTENPINLEKLQECLPELEALYQAKADAALMYASGLEAVAEQTGVDRRVLGKVVVALKKDKTEEARMEAQEVADLLESIAPGN